MLWPSIKQLLIAIFESHLFMFWAVRQAHLRCESCGCLSLESVEVNDTTVSLFLYVLLVFERLSIRMQLMWALTIDIRNANVVRKGTASKVISRNLLFCVFFLHILPFEITFEFCHVKSIYCHRLGWNGSAAIFFVMQLFHLPQQIAYWRRQWASGHLPCSSLSNRTTSRVTWHVLNFTPRLW